MFGRLIPSHKSRSFRDTSSEFLHVRVAVRVVAVVLSIALVLVAVAARSSRDRMASRRLLRMASRRVLNPDRRALVM